MGGTGNIAFMAWFFYNTSQTVFVHPTKIDNYDSNRNHNRDFV